MAMLRNTLESGEHRPVSSAEEHAPTQPTEKELKECRHVKNGLNKQVYFVAFLGLCERWAYYGIIVMFRESS